MRARRTPAIRLIDLSAPLKFDGAAACRKGIVDFVRGVRGERQYAVTEKQILAWFKSTPAEFVRARLLDVVTSGEVRCCRAGMSSSMGHDGRYVYEVAA